MAIVSIKALPAATIRSILSQMFFYSFAQKDMINAGLTKCSQKNLAKAVKNQESVLDNVQYIASKLNLGDLLDYADLVSYVSKAKHISDEGKKALVGHYRKKVKKPAKPEADDVVISASEAIGSGIRVEQASFIQAVQAIVSQYVRCWVLLVKCEFDVPAKNGSKLSMTDGKIKATGIELSQWASILRKLQVNVDDIFTVADKEAKISSWDWSNVDGGMEECLHKWAIQGLPKGDEEGAE